VALATEAERNEYIDRIPAERRATLTVGSAAQCAEALKPYIDAGFTGFTFGNTVYRTPEQIRYVAQMLPLIGG
jgi:alkanesulfonate monooxygenase SsuD/methylene tetrahydromethanopterin reductase-like flavin-dependent oxidoreductase (luciferase family)